ncbi:MAG TPA: hypothetical protein VL400_27365 [Polyangiaceae bacterium]|jgi:hypothetical protein|nr:hypothetical protein [Polyangiaceae bacterium]
MRAFTALVALTAFAAITTSACESGDETSCEELGELCHPVETDLGQLCHQIGHEGDVDRCAEHYDECIAECSP